MSASTRTSVSTPHTGSAPNRARQLAYTAAVSGAAFIAVMLLAGALDPGYSHLSEGISALASDESHAAGLMTLGFVFLGVTVLTAGTSLWIRLLGRVARWASALLMAAGLITVFDGFARQSCSSLQQSCLHREESGDVSNAHVLHNLSTVVLFVLLVLAGFLLASALKRDDRFTSLLPTRLMAALGLALMVWFGSGAYGDLGGLVQRGLVLVTYGLPVVVALRITRQEA